jgi:hypothetical protein
MEFEVLKLRMRGPVKTGTCDGDMASRSNLCALSMSAVAFNFHHQVFHTIEGLHTLLFIVTPCCDQPCSDSHGHSTHADYCSHHGPCWVHEQLCAARARISLQKTYIYMLQSAAAYTLYDVVVQSCSSSESRKQHYAARLR